MYTQDALEQLLESEFKGICTNCALASHCIFRMATSKIIIQCKSQQENVDAGFLLTQTMQRSLCTNCDKVDACQLPGKHTGIWHCEEYV